MTKTLPIGSFTLEVSNALSVTFEGSLLGTTESRQDEHNGHPNAYAPPGYRCYACRWSEYQLYRVTEWVTATLPFSGGRAERYVVASYGRSAVPGETTYRRVQTTDSPFEVIELLTTRKHGQPPQLTAAAARLLSRAAAHDDDIRDAWENRALL